MSAPIRRAATSRADGPPARPRKASHVTRPPSEPQGRSLEETVTVYGRTVTVKVPVIDALGYVAAGSELTRWVVVRDFPGHEKDDVFGSTNPTLSPHHIIESFSKRGALGMTPFPLSPRKRAIWGKPPARSE